jgi:hypothetical protein
MDDFMDVLIANLKVLASVPAGGRLSVRRGQLTVDTTTRGQFLVRFWHGDSRATTLQLVRNTANGAIRATESIMASVPEAAPLKDIWTLDHVARELASADFGLRNLRATYEDDAGTVAALEVISERMLAHCDVIRRFLERGAGPA